MKSFPKLKGKAILSPMAGVTDVAFRVLARKCGVALAYTEFVNSSAVVRQNKKTLKILQTDKSEKPSAVQIFVNDVKEIVKAAKILEEKFDIIDLNCGCADRKVTKIGDSFGIIIPKAYIDNGLVDYDKTYNVLLIETMASEEKR